MYFLPILSLLGYCVAIRHLMCWSVEAIPFFVITLVVSLLYIFGLFDVLQYGAEALVLFGLALLELAPWYVKSDDWMARHITPGFLFLVLFCIFFGFFAAHSHLHLWGEFSQWGGAQN